MAEEAFSRTLVFLSKLVVRGTDVGVLDSAADTLFRLH